MLNLIVKVLTWEGEFITNAFIEGAEFVEGTMGRFPTMVLLTLNGKRIYSWQYIMEPYAPLLEYRNGNW